jgi:hypothetical protein
MSSSTTTTNTNNTINKKKSTTFKNIKKSLGETLKRWGIYNTKESPKSKLVREIQELPEAPTSNIRDAIRERNSFLEKVQHDLKKDIETQEKRKKQLQEISRQIGTLKKRDKRRLINLEKQEEIMKTLKKTGFSITTEPKTLKALEKLPSPPKNNKSRTYKIPTKSIQFSEDYMEKEIGNEPLPYISYNQTYRKGGRKTHKKQLKKNKN